MNTIDNVGGFVVQDKEGYFSYIHKANAMHLSANQQYTLLFRKLQADGVNFKDIKKRLLNVAKKEGLYLENWKNEDTGVMEYRDFSALVKNKTAWAVALHNFLGWVSRNWVSYAEAKKETESVKKPSVKMTINIPTIGERKITIKGISEREYELWMEYERMISPVEKELSVEQLYNLYKLEKSTFSEFLADELEETGKPIRIPNREFTIGAIVH